MWKLTSLIHLAQIVFFFGVLEIAEKWNACILLLSRYNVAFVSIDSWGFKSRRKFLSPAKAHLTFPVSGWRKD